MGLMDGAIVLDKPAGMTSFRAVSKLRRLLGGVRAGHLGTLDPLGTGVLPVLLGRATRLARFYLGHSRGYLATVRFGWATTTYDADGEQLGEAVEVAPDPEEVEAALAPFRGKIRQVPPPVSAKRVGGVRAYKLARQRRPVRLEPAEVEVKDLDLLDVSGATAKLRCRCSAGTYVRSLAHDLGQALGCGAHVAALRRTSLGEFTEKHAFTLESLKAMSTEEMQQAAMISPVQLVPSLPVRRVDAVEASKIRHGRQFRVSPYGPDGEADVVKAVDPTGRLLCVARAVGPRMFHPFLVF